MTGSANRIAGGVGVVALETILRIVLRVATLSVLARLVSPGEFGVFAGVVAILEVLRPFASLGLDWALVQSPTMGSSERASVWVTVTAVAGGLSVILALLAPMLGDLLEMPALVPALWFACPVVLLNALGQTSSAFLTRKLAFRQAAIVEFAAVNVGGGVVPIALALMGGGSWALLAALHAEQVLRVALSFVAGVRKDFVLRGASGRALWPMLRFGAGQTLALALNAVALNGDYWVVGRFLGAQPLGLYNRAYQLISTPSGMIAAVAGRVLFPVVSRASDDPTLRERALIVSLSLGSILALPAAAVSLVCAEELILVLLGAAWEPAVGPFRIMALGVFFRSQLSVLGAFVAAAGRVWRFSGAQAAYAALVVGGALFAVRWELEGVAVATVAAMAGFLVILLLIASSVVAASRWRLVKAFFRGAHLAAISGVPAGFVVAMVEGPPAVRGGAAVVAALAFALAGVFARPRWFLGDEVAHVVFAGRYRGERDEEDGR